MGSFILIKRVIINTVVVLIRRWGGIVFAGFVLAGQVSHCKVLLTSVPELETKSVNSMQCRCIRQFTRLQD